MLFTVILAAAVIFIPVLADEEVPEEPIEYRETSTLTVPTETGERDVTADYVYVTGAGQLGIDMTADNRSVSATVDGDVLSAFGGAVISTKDSGSAVLKTGNIRGGFGISAYLSGGGAEADTGDIFAGEDTALDILIPGSGVMKFTGGNIFSSGYGVTLLTGVEYESYDFDDSGLDDDEGWLELDDGDDDWDDEDMYPEEPAEQENENQDPSGSSETDITLNSVEAGETAIDIELKNASTVTLTAVDAVFSDDKGVEIGLSETGSSVTLTAPVIDAGNQGLVISTEGGTVSVTNEDYISSDSAAEITNNGGTVTLTGGGTLDGDSGLYIEATGGKTEADTADINAQNYGIQVWTHEAVGDIPWETDGEFTGSDTQSGNTDPSGQAVPEIKVTVDGDITDQIDMTMPEESWGIEPEPELDPESESVSGSYSFTKDASDGGETEESDEEGSEGIIVDAETESIIEINVNGSVSMSYGNQIEASDNSKVTVSVQDDVITDYGNRIGSYDDAEVKVNFGGDINAGGMALDTDADSGTIEISVAGDILVIEAGNKDTAGIYATSEGTGKTTITVNGGIEVESRNDETGTSGISTFNNGGEITITVGKDVTAKGSGAVGLEVISADDGDAAAEKTETNVGITGNLTGTSKGLVHETADDADTKADIMITGTISGGDVSVEVSEETSSDNFDLTVWKIENRNGHAAVTPDGQASQIEPDIKYIVKIAEGQEDKIKAVDTNGNELPKSHGYYYAKEGERIYLEALNGYDLRDPYNGQVPLRKDEKGFYLDIPKGGAVILSPAKPPVPVPPPYYGHDDLFWLFDVKLPATGFSSSYMTMLPARPQGLSYRTTGLTLQIPGLDVSEKIVTVPEENGSYPVEWLGSDIGLLEQSSLPGRGIAVLTGHNHLNTTEAGPFLSLGSLENGERIMISDMRNRLQNYSVYGNYTIPADGFASLRDELRDKSLVLITCEEESAEGGYINRRVILAEPL